MPRVYHGCDLRRDAESARATACCWPAAAAAAAAYHVTFYWGDAQLDRDGIGVGTLDPAVLDVELDRRD